MGYRFLDHTADVLVELTAPSPEELLVEAVRAWGQLVLGGRQPSPQESRRFAQESRSIAQESRSLPVPGQDWEQRLVFLFNELIYCFDTARECWNAARILDGTPHPVLQLHGMVLPESWMPSVVVKAATYHGLSMKEVRGGVQALVVLDV